VRFANYTFTATLSDASEGVTTIHTDQGDITIANGQTVGHAGACVGQWRGRLQRRLEPDGDHHRTSGGNFENLVVGTGTATANVTDTSTDATVNLSASTVTEGAVAKLHVHGDAVGRLGRRHHDPHGPGRHHDCERPDRLARWCLRRAMARTSTTTPRA